MGVLPAYFAVQPDSAAARSLWEQAKLSYLDNPLPSLLKERLFAYLSRFCEAPYCIARHAAFLRGSGHPAGDPGAPPTSADDVLALLARPVLVGEEFDKSVAILEAGRGELEWPAAESHEEHALLSCVASIYLSDARRRRSEASLRAAFGEQRFEQLLALLAFIRTVHFWAESRTDLAYDSDVEEMLCQDDRLRTWVEDYQAAVANERGTRDETMRALERDRDAQWVARERSDALTAAFLNAAPDAIVAIDDRGTILGVNPAAEVLFGYAEGELVGQNVSVLMDAPDRESHLSYLKRYARTGNPRILGKPRGVSARARGGRVFPVRLSVGEARFGDRPVFTGVIHDLSAENELRSLLARQTELLDQAHECLYASDLDGRILFWNRAAERMFEITRDEAMGTSMEDILARTSADPGDADEVMQAVLQNGTHRRENPYTSPSGVEGYHQSVVTLARSTDGEPIGMVAVTQDILAERKALELLAESERRLRALFHQQSSLAGVCDLEGTLLEANVASLDYVGVDREDVIGRPFWETPWWSHDPVLQRVLKDAMERAAAGEEVRFDAELRRADGGLGTFDFVVTPIVDTNGAPEILLVESLDVTEQRSLQEQFLQSQKMEVIGTLAGGVAHDFNNLLTSILGSSEIIECQVEPGSRTARSNERIQKAAERAKGLTSQLLAFSRKQVTQPVVFELNQAVRRARDLFGQMIPENVEIKLDLDPAVEPIRFDPLQLDQVVINLAVNAGAAMPRGGALRISTRQADVSEVKTFDGSRIAPGQYAKLAVSDSGEGIAPAVRSQIFDPFFTTKEAGKGTGLGLSTIHAILARNGGGINFETRQGAGTTFYAYFPVATDQGPAANPSRERARYDRCGPATILVVEDDDLMCDLMAEVLEEEGHTVLRADQAVAALDLVRGLDGSLDLLITDVVMPGMSGFELARKICKDHESLAVLYMSGYSDQILADQGELPSADAFLCKPFGNEALIQRVRELLKRSRSQ